MGSSFIDDIAKLAGKTAILVGGGGGIGAEVCLALAEAGVDLLICDIDLQAMEDTAAAARALGRKVVTKVADARDPAALDAIFDCAGHEWPEGIDILVNVAGGVKQRMFSESLPVHWEADIRLNFGYVVQSIHRVIPLMRKRGGGSIVNFTTIEAHRGAASFAVYAGAKAATTNFTRAVAVELADEGIRVNCIAPDTTPSVTNMTALEPDRLAANVGLEPLQHLQAMKLYIPQGRTPSADELAKGVLFLASELSSATTGTTLHVDGGTAASMGFLRWPYGGGWLPTATAGAVSNMFPSERQDDWWP